MVRSADIPSKSRSQELFKRLQKFYSIVEQHVRNVLTTSYSGHLDHVNVSFISEVQGSKYYYEWDHG